MPEAQKAEDAARQSLAEAKRYATEADTEESNAKEAETKASMHADQASNAAHQANIAVEKARTALTDLERIEQDTRPKHTQANMENERCRNYMVQADQYESYAAIARDNACSDASDAEICRLYSKNIYSNNG
ncbi:hypothetical protein D3C85_1548650 [compost metagenome]